jgi:hypothetical protein
MSSSSPRHAQGEHEKIQSLHSQRERSSSTIGTDYSTVLSRGFALIIMISRWLYTALNRPYVRLSAAMAHLDLSADLNRAAARAHHGFSAVLNRSYVGVSAAVADLGLSAALNQLYLKVSAAMADVGLSEALNRAAVMAHHGLSAVSNRSYANPKYIAIVIVGLLMFSSLSSVRGPKCTINQYVDRTSTVGEYMEGNAGSDWVQQMMRFQKSSAGSGCTATESGGQSDGVFLDPVVYETDEEVPAKIGATTTTTTSTTTTTVTVRKRVFELEVVGKATYDVTLLGDCRYLEVRNEKSDYRILLPFGADWDFKKDIDSQLEDGVLSVVARKGHDADLHLW